MSVDIRKVYENSSIPVFSRKLSHEFIKLKPHSISLLNSKPWIQNTLIDISLLFINDHIINSNS